MDLGLKDKVAVVAAASKGLGKAVAEIFAQEGAKLAICARDESRILDTGDYLRKKYSTEVFAYACDVEDAAGIEKFSAEVKERFGTVHVLFTNAGGPPSGMLNDFTPDDFNKALNLNLMSALRLVYQFLPFMKAQRWGRIIASTSITVKQPIPTLVLSNVSRVGVVALIKSLSQEYASFNITANAVAPGYIMTERVENLFTERARKEGSSFELVKEGMEKSIPAGRIGAPEEFASLVAFLASERASYINGETILVDGGMYRGLM